jgi:hypothetical protein
MAKRFTDTEKWKKPFIRGLDGAYKLLWMYILDDCDHAGIWQVDFEVARIRTGEPSLDYEQAKAIFGERIIAIDKFKWFVPDFISFQYGELKESNRMHVSVISILTKHNLYNHKGHTSPLQGAKDKEQDKDKVMEQVQEKEMQTIEKKFNENWKLAFDTRTTDDYIRMYKLLDIADELMHFRLKCNGDPMDYYQRDPAGLRAGFLYQLKNGSKGKNGTKKEEVKRFDLTGI